jgi:phenylpropionate dioxygenase-like ring-hydroxylating dioxygenase large terminal subunit
VSELDSILSPERLAGARLPLEKATTLPVEAYTSDEIYDREVRRLFHKEWICAGRVDQIPAHGDYFTIDLLGHKLVVVRDSDDDVRVLSRICRHRFAEIVHGTGNTRSFQCPYHSWTYRLDGALVGAPMMEEVDFDRAGCRLPETRSEVWEGWIFVTLDAHAPPLSPRLAPLSKLLARYRIGDLVATQPAVYESPFNWKILVDNFMESYHHIAVHRDTLEPVFPARQSFVADSEGPYSVLRMPSVIEASPGGLPQIEGLEGWQRNELVAIVVYPFHLFALSSQSMSWYQILPGDVGCFELRIHTCFPRETLEDPAHTGACQALHEFTQIVHAQDIKACETVWQGVNSAGTPPGRLHRLEGAIWQQNQWWIERMVG